MSNEMAGNKGRENIRKVELPDEYPPEEGCYLRGNDFSPVAVVVILNRRREETPPDIEKLTRTAIESGAALAGTLQTENIGIEKIICNLVANPNIRYIVLCGPESQGHLTGESLLAVVENGVDSKRRIVGSNAPTPYLFNISSESVERFRKQITIIDLLNRGTPELVREAVYLCYQESPASFEGYTLYDTGAYAGLPIVHKITWRVTHPQREPKDDEEREQVEKLKERMAWIKARMEEKRRKNHD